MTRSNRPWTTSNPADLLELTAASRRSLRAPTSVLSSANTISEISKIFNGNGIFLFDAAVFNRPDISEVRATSNSRVFGFPMCTAGISSIFRWNLVETSSREHWRRAGENSYYKLLVKDSVITHTNEKVRASENPDWATCSRNCSVNLLSGNWRPKCIVAGNVRLMLLYPWLMATSS